jgi:hypothetical protein
MDSPEHATGPASPNLRPDSAKPGDVLGQPAAVLDCRAWLPEWQEPLVRLASRYVRAKAAHGTVIMRRYAD